MTMAEEFGRLTPLEFAENLGEVVRLEAVDDADAPPLRFGQATTKVEDAVVFPSQRRFHPLIFLVGGPHLVGGSLVGIRMLRHECGSEVAWRHDLGYDETRSSSGVLLVLS